jgi:hypothetical protein
MTSVYFMLNQYFVWRNLLRNLIKFNLDFVNSRSYDEHIPYLNVSWFSQT